MVLEGSEEFGHFETWSWNYQGSRDWREDRIRKDTEVEKCEGHSRNAFTEESAAQGEQGEIISER